LVFGDSTSRAQFTDIRAFHRRSFADLGRNAQQEEHATFLLCCITKLPSDVEGIKALLNQCPWVKPAR